MAGDNASKLALVHKRVDAEDQFTIDYLAGKYYYGRYGLEKNVPRAIELWTEAAELGLSQAHFNLGNVHYSGKSVPCDEARALKHWEAAAMKGHVEARGNLGDHKCKKANCQRAVRHYLIAAKMGAPLDSIKKMFARGHATKQQYGDALSGYQAATEEMKSPERDEVKELMALMKHERPFLVD